MYEIAYVDRLTIMIQLTETCDFQGINFQNIYKYNIEISNPKGKLAQYLFQYELL